MKLNTVAVNRNGTKVLINESNYVEGEDRLWSESEPQSEKEALIEALAAHGIEKDKRTSVANLRKALAEVE